MCELKRWRVKLGNSDIKVKVSRNHGRDVHWRLICGCEHGLLNSGGSDSVETQEYTSAMPATQINLLKAGNRSKVLGGKNDKAALSTCTKA